MSFIKYRNYIQLLSTIRMKQYKLLTGLIILGLSSCSETSDSNDYNPKEDRVKVLKKEIKSFSEFENAEFELFNVNGFSNSRTTLPGASSWNYKFVIKVNPTDVDKWTEGMILIDSDEYDDSWMKKIIQERANEWRTDSEPEYYTRKGNDVMMIVFRPEGIIFKSVVNL